jgi:hypothetical protein
VGAFLFLHPPPFVALVGVGGFVAVAAMMVIIAMVVLMIL